MDTESNLINLILPSAYPLTEGCGFRNAFGANLTKAVQSRGAATKEPKPN
jgi:hypothetical protein